MPPKTRIAIETLGCKLNQAESEALTTQFASACYLIVAGSAETDVYILNTCTVTHIADRKSRLLLRAARRRSPHALIIATGCYADRPGQELGATQGINLVVPNEAKPDLVGIVSRMMPPGQCSTATENGGRTRAFIKVQDGCNRRCAYCIVPTVRGEEKSRPAGEIISEISSRTAGGYKEAVLTGTEIGSYSHEGLDIKALLERVLAETDIPRLRVSSLQPFEINTGLLSLWQNPRLCPHFHISLQSGSDSVLERMQRGYSASGYAAALAMIREALPGASITTDVILGFPGETDREFLETVDFCREAGFARIHVFPYSARPGTAAAEMPGQVEARLKKQRTEKMLEMAQAGARAFQGRFLGKTLDVLWEQKSKGVWSGYTTSYIRVYTRGARDLTNVVTVTRLLNLYRDGILGVCLDPGEKA